MHLWYRVNYRRTCLQCITTYFYIHSGMHWRRRRRWWDPDKVNVNAKFFFNISERNSVNVGIPIRSHGGLREVKCKCIVSDPKIKCSWHECKSGLYLKVPRLLTKTDIQNRTGNKLTQNLYLRRVQYTNKCFPPYNRSFVPPWTYLSTLYWSFCGLAACHKFKVNGQKHAINGRPNC